LKYFLFIYNLSFVYTCTHKIPFKVFGKTKEHFKRNNYVLYSRTPELHYDYYSNYRRWWNTLLWVLRPLYKTLYFVCIEIKSNHIHISEWDKCRFFHGIMQPCLLLLLFLTVSCPMTINILTECLKRRPMLGQMRDSALRQPKHMHVLVTSDMQKI